MGALLIETGKYNEGIRYLKSVKEKTNNAVNLNLAIGYFLMKILIKQKIF